MRPCHPDYLLLDSLCDSRLDNFRFLQDFEKAGFPTPESVNGAGHGGAGVDQGPVRAPHMRGYAIPHSLTAVSGQTTQLCLLHLQTLLTILLYSSLLFPN